MSKSTHRSKTTRKGQTKREQHQRKACVRDQSGKGKKCMRGEPEYYSELKKLATFSLTPTAKSGLNLISRNRSISMSELIERIGRGIIKITDEEGSENI